MKKFMLRVMPIVLVVMMVVTCPVLAISPQEIESLADGQGVGNVNNAVNSIWSTVLTVLQILAIAAVVFAGVKYMFAAADQKAEIKNGMIGLVVGAILVFAASTIVQFIINAANEVI